MKRKGNYIIHKIEQNKVYPHFIEIHFTYWEEGVGSVEAIAPGKVDDDLEKIEFSIQLFGSIALDSKNEKRERDKLFKSLVGKSGKLNYL